MFRCNVLTSPMAYHVYNTKILNNGLQTLLERTKHSWSPRTCSSKPLCLLHIPLPRAIFFHRIIDFIGRRKAGDLFISRKTHWVVGVYHGFKSIEVSPPIPKLIAVSIFFFVHCFSIILKIYVLSNCTRTLKIVERQGPTRKTRLTHTGFKMC